MKESISEEKFDFQIETSDWRYSASILGLKRYFDYLHSIDKVDRKDSYMIDEDIFKYNSIYITEEDYLMFVEKNFKEVMHHIKIEELLQKEEILSEDIAKINEKLKANSIMKKIFNKISYSEESKGNILNLINENRLTIIKETYKRGKSLYENFANNSLLFSEENKICRLQGYYVDTGRKLKSVAYKQDAGTFEFEDDMVFDFIPFAFSKTYDSFFINNNTTVDNLENTAKILKNLVAGENPRETLFGKMKEASDYIDFDVEVIVKNRDEDYFKTLFIRKKAINIFKQIENYKGLQVVYRGDPKNPKFMESEVVDAILNDIRLDSIIEMLLRDDGNYSFNIKSLIEANILIYGGNEKMNKNMKSAYAAAKEVSKKLEENKLRSYRQKLISAITFKDSSKVCETLIQLSSYSGVQFNFVYDLFENYDDNKNLIYTFVQALAKGEDKKGGNENEG
ncbi:MAG: type I CRISPR-associated protein Cas8a1/Csx8 [Clostridium sp.]|uniref:type I CRISPR-associated protein Cas8a1/Csx8 n=1 Tax=Clostridium sp. TaxID=1506 RepID=UPI003F370FE2